MKEELRKKLEKPEIDRTFFWFWKNWVREDIGITYQHFMLMLAGTSPLRDDVRKTIKSYLDNE